MVAVFSRIARSKRTKIAMGGAALSLGVAVGAAGAALAPNASVVHALAQRLPRTKVSSVDCHLGIGLCEVVAGKSVFYVDNRARYLVIGRVYDMQTRQDLTAAKLLQVNPDMLLGSAAGANSGNKEGGPADELPGAAAAGASTAGLTHGNRAAAQATAAGVQHVDLTKLGNAGAIVWGHSAGRPVTIFTDFHCGYCRALVNELEEMDVRVIERPISTLGSRDIANRVYCAADKAKAIKAAYADEPLKASNCDTSGLDANEAFAREHGFAGTPIIVRQDGAVLEGFRPKDQLEAWLRGGV